MLSTKAVSLRRAAALVAVFALALAVRSLYAVDQAPVMYTPEQTGTRMAQRYDDTIKALLKDRQDNKGWLVVFLGADVDAFGEAQSIGIGDGKYLALKKGKLRQSMQYAAASQARYAESGDLNVADFLKKERDDAGKDD